MQSIILSKTKSILKYKFKEYYKRLRIVKYRLLSSNKIRGEGFSICQPVLVNGKGVITAGRDTTFGWESSPGFYSSYSYIEARSSEATIVIGEQTIINNNAKIISDGAGIVIGHDCLIGIDCEIIDSDFHCIEPIAEKRKHGLPRKKKVKIGNNVFIGNGVKILKGVCVGDNAVIASGSVLTSEIPENAVAGGIPAKVLKIL
jgi:maltose O-acetyltransferase